MGLDNSGGRVAIRCSGTLIVVRRHFVWGGVVLLVVEFLARPKKDLFHGCFSVCGSSLEVFLPMTMQWLK